MASRKNYYELEGINYEELIGLFDNFVVTAGFNISEVKKQKTLNIFLIHLQRIGFNQHISINREFKQSLKQHDIYPLVENLFHHFYIFDDREIAYFFYIMTLDEELNRDTRTNLAFNYFKEHHLELMTLTDLIFSDLASLFRPLTDEEIYLIKRDIFYTNFVTMIFNQLIFEYKYGITVHYNTKQYPIITSIFSEVITKRLIDTKHIQESQLPTLLQQYFFRFLYFIDPKHLYKIISIYIEPAFDFLHQKQMKEYLNLYFNHQIEYVEKFNDQTTDVVLTPFHEASEHSLYVNTPIIMVKFPLNLIFLQKVEKILIKKQKSQ